MTYTTNQFTKPATATSALPQSVNAEAMSVWSEIVAPKWLRFRHNFSVGAALHSRRALEALRPVPGARVLDIGCGTGETVLELADLVGPSGHVVGQDCVPEFLELARLDARENGVGNIDFVLGDAQ